jgi:hypothetical protein
MQTCCKSWRLAGQLRCILVPALSCFCGAPLLQVWRGEHYACSHSEYLQVKRQLMSETHAPAAGGRDAAAEGAEGSSGGRSWQELSSEEQGRLLKERLKKYTQKVRAPCKFTTFMMWLATAKEA